MPPARGDAPPAGPVGAGPVGAGPVTTGPPLVVEFLGLPGAGKTTVVKAVASELARQGVEVTEVFANWNRGRLARATDTALALSALARFNRAALATALRLASARGLGRTTALNLALNWSNRCGRLETARRSTGVQLVDQGVFQAYWSLAYAAGQESDDTSAEKSDDRLNGMSDDTMEDKSDETLNDMFARLEAVRPPLDALVLVHADPSVIAERLARRPGATSRLERALAGELRPEGRAVRGPGSLARPGSGPPGRVGPVSDGAAAALAAAEGALALVLALARAASAASGHGLIEVENRAADMGRGAAASVVAALTDMRGETVYKDRGRTTT